MDFINTIFDFLLKYQLIGVLVSILISWVVWVQGFGEYLLKRKIEKRELHEDAKLENLHADTINKNAETLSIVDNLSKESQELMFEMFNSKFPKNTHNKSDNSNDSINRMTKIPPKSLYTMFEVIAIHSAFEVYSRQQYLAKNPDADIQRALNFSRTNFHTSYHFIKIMGPQFLDPIGMSKLDNIAKNTPIPEKAKQYIDEMNSIIKRK